MKNNSHAIRRFSPALACALASVLLGACASQLPVPGQPPTGGLLPSGPDDISPEQMRASFDATTLSIQDLGARAISLNGNVFKYFSGNISACGPRPPKPKQTQHNFRRGLVFMQQLYNRQSRYGDLVFDGTRDGCRPFH